MSSDSQYSYFLDNEGDVTISGEDNFYEHKYVRGKHIKEIISGQLFTLMLDNEGNVWGMGYNRHGKLGLGNNSQYFSQPVQLPLKNIRKMFTDDHQNVFFVDTKNNIWACGYNSHGELGLGHTNTVYVPTQLPLKNVCYVTQAVWYNTLFVHTDGTLSGCGKNGNGELGLEHFNPQLNPTPLNVRIENFNYAEHSPTPAQTKIQIEYKITKDSIEFEILEKKVNSIIARFEINSNHGFFSMGMNNKAKQIEIALKNLKMYADNNNFRSVDEMLDHKDTSDPQSMSLRQALNINRLPVKQAETKSLKEVKREFSLR